jgi:hypothetical protein
MISVVLGYWIIPAALTIAAFAWALPMRDNERPNGGMFDGLGYAMGSLFRTGAALITSLAVWLIWALLT